MPGTSVSMGGGGAGQCGVRLEAFAEPQYEDLDDVLVVARYARALEREIIDSPADWLWLQKKWKYSKPAPGDDTISQAFPAR